MTWNEAFLDLFNNGLAHHKAGHTNYNDFKSFYSKEDLSFLQSIGCKPRELFDFIEDLADAGQPAATTALLIAAVRRDYFLAIQDGVLSTTEITSADLPTFGAELEGMQYLPRIIAKARHKLRGELDPDVMYGCGGDRRFLKGNGNIHLADFLRNVWAADGDDAKVAAYVKAQS